MLEHRATLNQPKEPVKPKRVLVDACPDCQTENVSMFPSYKDDCQACLKRRLEAVEAWDKAY